MVVSLLECNDVSNWFASYWVGGRDRLVGVGQSDSFMRSLTTLISLVGRHRFGDAGRSDPELGERNYQRI